jgi:hypothetical protein
LHLSKKNVVGIEKTKHGGMNMKDS